MAKFLAEKAKQTGVDQQLGPLNPYERRIVHLAVAEVPGVDDRKRRRRVLEDRLHLRYGNSRRRLTVRRRSPASWHYATVDCCDVFSTSDTIVAIATPPGRGGIGVVRLSGPTRTAIAGRLDRRTRGRSSRGTRRSRRCVRARQHAVDAVDCSAIDHVVVTYFPAPAFVHRRRRRRAQRARQPGRAARDRRGGDRGGARLAEPGEFTLRAFLNGRIDLMQAEAVADLDRRRDAAAGARGVRSAAGHADARDRARSTRRCSI